MFGLQILDEGDVVWVDGDFTRAARVVRTEREWLGNEDDTVVVEWSSKSKKPRDAKFSRGRLNSVLREGDRVQIPRNEAGAKQDVPGIPNAPLTAEGAFCGPGSSSENGPDLEASVAGNRLSIHSITKRCTITPCLDGEQGQYYTEASVIKVPPRALLAAAVEDADDDGIGTDKKGAEDKNAVPQSPSAIAAARGLYVVKLDGTADGHFQAYHRNAMIETPKVPIEVFSPFFIADVLIGDPVKNQNTGVKNAIKASLFHTLLLGIPSCIFPVIAVHLDLEWVSGPVTLWVTVYHLISIVGSCLYYTKQVPWRKFRYIVAITNFMLTIQVTAAVLLFANTTFWLLAMITVCSIFAICAHLSYA
jgi:hypothetical protein